MSISGPGKLSVDLLIAYTPFLTASLASAICFGVSPNPNPPGAAPMLSGVMGSLPPLACCVAWVDGALLAEVISKIYLKNGLMAGKGDPNDRL